MIAEVEPAARAVRSRAGEEPFDLAIVLGSGLGEVGDEVAGAAAFSYGELPEWPATTVAGHSGRLLAGLLEGARVLVFAGRFHMYEGLSARQVTLPVRLARALGCGRLLLTNAAGGINPDFAPGDPMFICDHINLLGDNPLRGVRENPFLDLSRVYEDRLHSPLSSFAREAGIPLRRGVLAALPGPSYETPAEVRMLGRLGADAVSMSTVPEAIMGKYLGMEVAGLSLIANAAAGLAPGPLDHAEVLEASRRGAASMARLVRGLAALWLSPCGSASSTDFNL